MRRTSAWMLSVLFALMLAQPVLADTIIVQGTILQNTTWTSNNVYLLRGGVFVGNDQTQTILTIQPGTVIKGESASGGFLCIRRHSKIIADGTASQPITFTSDRPVGQQARGDWGGIIINGLAHVNLTGGVGQGEGGTGFYGGGLTPNDNDDSGILRYVRVAYAGYPITPEDELNGIAFQGVGAGTIVDYVHVHMGGDDGIEMFGGSVNLKHCLSTGNLDDQFDWTFGWNGKAQFLICQEYGDVGDHGFECDNNEFNYSATPRSNPTIYNVTAIGATNPVSNPIGLLLRRGTGATIKNSIVMNFEDCGIDIDDAATFANAWDSTTQSLNGNLIVDNSIFYGNGEIAQTGETGSQNEANFPFTSPQFIQVLNPNNRFTNPNLIAPTDTLNPDFRPAAGSIAFTGYAQPPADPFFSAAAFVGAVGDEDWTSGWRLAPTPGIVVQPIAMAAGWNLVSLSVVPVNNTLSALFPAAIVAYKYVPGTGYVNSTTIENGKGYWINMPSATTVNISGTAFASYTTPVTPPWELLGSVINPDQVPVAVGGSINVVYSYNPGTGYVASPENMMQPGKGYWVNMTSGTTAISLGGSNGSLTAKSNEGLWLDETDELWNLTLTATGETGSAPNVFTVTIGGGNSQSFIPAPPPPPSYLTYAQLYTETWQGPYSEMIYPWNSPVDVLWKLEVDPNGNVVPPIYRTTIISWNSASLPSAGDFRIVDAVYGDTVVANMRTQSSFQVSGTQLKYYNIIFDAPLPPAVDISLSPIGSTTIPASGGMLTFDATLQNTNPSAPVTFQVWMMVRLPNQSWWGPALGPISLTLPPGASITRERNQTVPANAPAGDYFYCGYVGTYPNAVFDSSGFAFTKSPVGDGFFVNDWSNSGELFEAESEAVPTEFAVVNAYPNPFNPNTTVQFSLSQTDWVSLRVYDLSGREVASLVDGQHTAGVHQVSFNAEDLASGIYLVTLRAGAFSATSKLVLLK